MKIRPDCPVEIIAAFEAPGFFYGGQQFPYGALHGAYRPELLEKAQLRASQPRGMGADDGLWTLVLTEK